MDKKRSLETSLRSLKKELSLRRPGPRMLFSLKSDQKLWVLLLGRDKPIKQVKNCLKT